MDEVDLVRALRPEDYYPDAERQAARTALLEAAAGREAPAARPPSPARRRRRTAWQAGLTGTLAAGVTAAVLAAYAASGGAGARPGTQAGGQAGPPKGTQTAAQVLEVAAQTAHDSAAVVPPGARWVVRETRATSTAWARPQCGQMAFLVSGSGATKPALRGLACPAQAPDSIPGLAGAKPVRFPAPAFGNLPDQPGPLLAALYRQAQASADALPGHRPPRLTSVELREYAFDDITLMLSSGATLPSRSVQLATLAMIPGLQIAHGENALGRRGIVISMAGVVGPVSMVFDAGTYDLIGSIEADYPRFGGVTQTSAVIWTAYYDAGGHRV